MQESETYKAWICETPHGDFTGRPSHSAKPQSHGPEASAIAYRAAVNVLEKGCSGSAP